MVLVCSAYGQRPSYPIVLGVSGGIAMGIGSSQLFEGYRQATGLRSNDFNVPLTAGAVVFVDVGGLRLGASSDVYFAQSLERGTPQNAPQRVLEEDLRLTMMPVLFTVEWEPWREQFRTFVSAGVGAAFARFQWYESVWSNGRQERWRINADMRKTVPALRLAAGTYLFFDAQQVASLHGGVVLSLSYTYSPVRVPALRSYVDVSSPSTQQWNDNILVGGSALMLSVGVRFQIGRHS